MANRIFTAILKDDHLIEVRIPKKYNAKGCSNFYLYNKEELLAELKIISKSETNHHFNYILNNVPDLAIGEEYTIFDERNINFPVDISILMRSMKRILPFQYDGELGAIYTPTATTFRLFSPLGTRAYVRYEKDGISNVVSLKKLPENGIFEGTINGDLEKATYQFVVRINGEFQSAVDPYAKGLTALSLDGVVVNPKSVEVDLNNDKLTPIKNPTDAIIYELSVRDMTFDTDIDFKNRRSYLGLTEHGLKTKAGLPAGIDYIKSLGVTHVQILPIFDFCTVNDLRPEDSYNWGYDPLNYFTPEGSYASNPRDPYSRIIETKKMVAAFHKEGIRVIQDVVFNHVFCYENSNLELLCPNYYFRFNPDGTLSNGSFCGNEVESTHFMCRKLIIDCCKYWVKEYGIDGLRFDLMGLIDIKTLNTIYQECRLINPDFIMYGEGWDMPSSLEYNQKGTIANANLLPNIGFFNDRFRDVSKGKSGDLELDNKGYLLGDTNYIDGFKNVYMGSCTAIAFPPLFLSPSQSINYVECHDNATLFDKIKIANNDEDLKTQLKRLNLVNALTVLSFGVPFIHAGQEIGLSKQGNHNSYNAGDLINHFDYSVLDQRKELYLKFIDIVKLKKKYSFLRLESKSKIMDAISLTTLDNGILLVDFVDKEILGQFQNVKIFINPSTALCHYDLDDYYQVIFNEAGLIDNGRFSQHLQINGLTLLIVAR